MLYGPERLKAKRFRTSLALFRRVIPVPVSESAGPDLVALAAESASNAPMAVLFPYRYLEGGRFYKENHQEVPVLVMGGKPESKEGEPLAFVRTDTDRDLYRAGLCAAFLAGEKRVLFFSDGILQNEYREAFLEGLRIQGYLDDPIYVNAYTDYSNYSDIGCVIVAGAAAKFFEQNLDIPVILFSWIDPALCPRTVKLVFDDSPWTQAVKALKVLPLPGEEILVFSEPSALPDRMEEKKDFRKLQSLIREKFQKN
jgi:hypothetical protein